MFFLRKTLPQPNIKGLFMSFYAVARGHNVGIYDSWSQCAEQVKGFKGAKYKKFKSRPEAEAFVQNTTGIVAPETSNSTPEDFWPEEQTIELNSLEDSELLAAVAAFENQSNGETRATNKRKSNTDGESKAKLKKHPVHVSNVWKPVGSQKINEYTFEIDSEGYVIVYTDGSCINNGRPDACAGLGVYFGENHPLNMSRPVTGRVTNNVGEIQAAIHAIKTARTFGIEKLCVSTDSQFLINSITMWINAWKQKEWRLKNGEPVKNAVDFKELDELLRDDNMKVKWNYVKGHHCIAGNQMADKLAREGSDMYRRLNKTK
ncbi:ribonuclease H1-like isoform X1 [Rhagoletis pomonella]|uniref:ribonuclease H1-like isoform X1 n=1 Tax=Rhagoletis pomonella TaxID=28610 RepID=UPI001781FDC0|nr:ribonuclease H1-like isoform X1 [Rhagoletis pomonella]